MNPPGQNHPWLSFGKRLIVSSLVLLIPTILAVLYFAYSFSFGYVLQTVLMYSIIGVEVGLFLLGVILVTVARSQKSSRDP